MLSKEYKNILRKRLIQRFVRENDRAPTTQELISLVNREEEKYSQVDEIGIAGFDIIKPTFQSVSSSADENANRGVLLDDLLTLNKKLDNLFKKEEDSYKFLLANLRKSSKDLDELNGRLDNLLNIYRSGNEFLYGVEEHFTDQTTIDFLNSTASINPNNVSLRKRRLHLVDLEKCKIKSLVLANNGYLSYSTSGQVKAVLSNNSEIWNAVVKTSYQIGRVTLLLEIALPTPTDISNLKISGMPIEGNKATTVSVAYSINNKTFNTVLPVEIALTEKLILPLNIKGARKIQIMLAKEACDHFIDNEGEYIFSLDKIDLETSLHESSLSSTVFCGPYVIYNTQGERIIPSKVTLTTCSIVPNGTSINYAISVNKENWLPIDPSGNSSNYVSLGNNTYGETQLIDTSLSKYKLIKTLDLEHTSIRSNAYLNTYIPNSTALYLAKQSIVIKRNLPNSNVDIILGTSPGWYFDKQKHIYKTTVFIENQEGRVIDLGLKGAYLNGKKVTGETRFPYGYSIFETDSSNWEEIDSIYYTEEALSNNDTLYPYNHRYLIAGYSYPTSFVGSKRYLGGDEYFGSLLAYISPEEFETFLHTNSNYYDVFTLEEVDDNLYIKVKVNEHSSTWQEELFEVSFKVHSNIDANLYVRAILNSDDELLTPVLESFKLRVI